MTKGKVVDKTGWHYTITENAIHDTELLSIYEKAIYFALKRFANIQTNESFPGVKKLAAISRMSERKARDTIRDLEKKGIINVQHRENDTSIYTILPTPAQYAGGASHAGDLRHDMQHPPAHDADELKRIKLKRIEQELDQRPQQAADRKIPNQKDDEVLLIFDRFMSKGIVNHQKLTGPMKTAVKARLKDYSFEQLIQVIDNYSTVYKSDDYWFSYKYNFADLMRDKDVRKFIDDADPLTNFATDKAAAAAGANGTQQPQRSRKKFESAY